MQPGPKVLAYFLGNENLPIIDTCGILVTCNLIDSFCLYIKEKIKNCAWPYTGSSRNYIGLR